MSSTIKIKRNAAAGVIPGSLEVGELAVNLFDRKLYVGNTTGVTAVGGEDFRLTTSNTGGGGIGPHLKLLGAYAASTNTVLMEPGEGIDITVQANGAFLFAGEDASDSNKGVASFDSADFAVTSGAVTLSDSATGAVLEVGGTANEITVGRLLGTATIGLTPEVTIANTLSVTGNTAIGGNLTVSGGLDVTGSVTYLSSSTVYTDDGMMKLSANNAGDVTDTGIYALYNDGVTNRYSGYFRDATDGIFRFYANTVTEPTTTVDASDASYALATIEAVLDGGTY
jgi:hypothetical protein